MAAEPEPMSSNIETVGALRANWAWFVTLGALLVAVGVIALGSLVTTALVTVTIVGLMLVVGGVVEILHGLRAQAWGRFLWELLSGALTVLCGIFAIVDPLLASAAITLLIGLALIVGGAMRIVLGIELRHAESWVWVVLGGLVTLLCGVLIASRWPFSSLWVIGALLGVNLIIHGATWIQFGLVLRPRR
jgi:uncharacterized membrane protein HdeD (DUF308 family)